MKIALLILVLHSVASAQDMSLGDLARQERVRQKSATNIPKFTNETLGTAAADPEPPPATIKAASEPGKSVAAESAATDAPHDEAWWREAFRNAREDARRADDRVTVLQLERNKLNTDLLTRDDIFNREGVLGPQIATKNAEITAAEKQADQAHQKVTQLESDLRRAGAPAGWAR